MAKFINFKTKDEHHLINIEDISSLSLTKGDCLLAVTKSGSQWTIRLQPGQLEEIVALDKLATATAKDAELWTPNGDILVASGRKSRREEYERIKETMDTVSRVAKLKAQGEL